MCADDRERFENLWKKIPIPTKISVGSQWWKEFLELLELNNKRKYNMIFWQHWWFLIKTEDKENHKQYFPTHRTWCLENYIEFILLATNLSKVSDTFQWSKEQIQISKIDGELYLPGTQLSIILKSKEYDGKFTFNKGNYMVGLAKALLKDEEINMKDIESSSESSSESKNSDSDTSNNSKSKDQQIVIEKTNQTTFIEVKGPKVIVEEIPEAEESKNI